MAHYVPTEIATPTRILWRGRWLVGLLVHRLTGRAAVTDDAASGIKARSAAGAAPGLAASAILAPICQRRSGVLEVGQPAPDFALSGTKGEVRLSDLLAAGPVVLTFYVEDATPACTQQLTAFGNEFATLAALGAQVLAVSADDLDTHRQFDERLGGLPFPLLADPDLRVARLYGVADEEYKRAQRAVFVIAPEGTIRQRIVPYVPASTEQFLSIFEALGLEA